MTQKVSSGQPLLLYRISNVPSLAAGLREMMLQLWMAAVLKKEARVQDLHAAVDSPNSVQ
jgi:hypothetical protein